MTIYYWQGCVNQEEFPEQAVLIQRVLNGEANVEKMVDFRIYKTRINRADRLFWITQIIDGKPFIRVLDVILNHDYQKSKYLKKGVLKQYLENLTKCSAESRDCDNLDEIPCLDATFSQQALYYNQQFIQFNDDQQRALRMPLPVVVSGPAGSGKSCVLFQVLHSLLERMPADESGKILYVAKSKKLVITLKKMWGKLSDSNLEKVEFKYYDELVLSDSRIGLTNKVGDEFFFEWLESYIKRSRHDAALVELLSRDKKAVHEEFRIISCFAREEGFLTKQAYLDLGVKQSLFHCSKESFDPKPVLLAAYESYQRTLTDGAWDPAFYDLNRKAEYYAVAVDEALDLSMLQLISLYDMSTNGQIYYAMDSHQRFDDRLSQRALLLTMLSQLIGRRPAHIQLQGSHRCPNAVIRLSNAVIELKSQLTEGIADSNEMSVISESPDLEKDKGDVFWLQPSLDEDAHLRMLKSTNCAVITRDCYRKEAEERYGTSIVHTPERIKGLEYQDVIAYRLFDDEAGQFIEANRKLTNYRSQSKIYKHRPKRDHGQAQFALVFNPVISAITRTTGRLFFVQEKKPELAAITTPLIASIVRERGLEASLSEKKITASTEQDWYAQAQLLLQNGNEEQARSIFLRELGKTTHEFIEFKAFHESKDNEVLPVDAFEAKPAAISSKRAQAVAVAAPAEPLSTTRINKKSESKKSIKTDEKLEEKNAIDRLLMNFNSDNLDALFRRPKSFGALTYIVTEKGDSLERCLLEYILYNTQRQKIFCDFLMESERSKHFSSLIDRLSREQVFPNGFTALHVAAITNCSQLIEIIAAKGGDIQCSSKHGETPLYLAIVEGNQEAERALIQAGAKRSNVLYRGVVSKKGYHLTPLFVAIDYGSSDLIKETKLRRCKSDRAKFPCILGASDLFKAAQEGDLDSVNRLINMPSTDINQAIGSNAVFALLIAVQHAHSDIVQALISAGVNVNQRAVDGATALLVASQFGFVNIVALLIRAGADVELEGRNGCTPLMSAVNFGHFDIARMLIYFHADFLRKMNTGQSAFDISCVHGNPDILELFQMEKRRLTISNRLLESLTQESLLDFFKDQRKIYFLSRKIEFIEQKRYSLLWYILKNPAYVTIFCNILKMGDFGQDILNTIASKLDFDGSNTALNIAVELNCVEFIKLWSQHMYPINLSNRLAFKPIHLAIYHGHLAAVNELIRAGANLGVDWKGYSLLHYAVNCNGDLSHIGVICRLLKAGVDINEPLRPENNATVLFLAAKAGNMRLVKLFLSERANVDQACSNGMTPLMIASIEGHLDIIKLLLSYNADMMKENNNGDNAVFLATKYNHTDIINVFSTAAALLRIPPSVSEGFFGRAVRVIRPDQTSLPHDSLHPHAPPRL